MEYSWIENIDEFHSIAEEWDEAVRASGSYNPFLLSDFIVTWWKYYKDGLRLRIFVIRDSGKIAGGIPLCTKEKRGIYAFAKTLQHVGGDLANYTEPLYTRRDIPVFSMLKSALEGRKDWDTLYLPNVHFESTIMSECKDHVLQDSFMCNIIQDHMNMAIDFSSGKDRYMAGLPRKLRKDLRSKRRHAVREYGEISLRKISGPEEVGKFYDMHTRFSLDAFGRRGRRSNFEDERYLEFFKDLLIRLDRKGMIDAYALYAGNDVMAIIFGYRFGRGFNWVLTAFNYKFNHLRPGYLLIEELINELAKRGDTICNCYGYGSFYKDQWCNKKTPLCRFFMVRRSVRGFCYNALQAVETNLRSNKIAVSMVRKFKKA